MDPLDDDDSNPFDESDETEPIIRELQLEMVRLQAQIDQLAASSRQRAEEIADLRARMAALESQLGSIRARFRRDLKMWVWVAGLYGTSIGIGITYLMRI